MIEVDVTIHEPPEEPGDKYQFKSIDTEGFRVRCEMDNWKKFRKFLLTVSKIHFVVFETPRNENPHVHAVIESDKSEDAIKRARTRFFKEDPDMKGNGVASISDCQHYKEYIEYLCKGRYAVKERGVYRKADEPDHNKIEILERTKDFDYCKAYNDFWDRHRTPITKTQQKKRFNFTEELCRDVEKTFGFVEYRYIDNYSKAILGCSEDEVLKGWYKPESTNEILDLQQKYKQSTPTIITRWLIDVFCHRCKIFDEYIIARYLNLIINKYRHHFAGLLHDQSSRVKSILNRAGYSALCDEEAYQQSDIYENKSI